MNVLRITPSFSSKEAPGSGLNAFSHSSFSRFSSDVFTEHKKNTLFIPDNANIYSFKVPLFGLKHNSSFLMLSILMKVFQVILFSLKCTPLIFKNRYKVIHCYTPIYFLPALISKVLYGTKIFVSFHGTDLLTLKKLRLQNFFVRFVDCILLTANVMFNDFDKKYHSKIRFMGNGFDTRLFNFKNHERNKTILNVSSLRWQKNHELLIRAFYESGLFKKGYNVMLVGKGPLKSEIDDLVKSLNLTEYVSFFDSLTQEELASEYNHSCCFALTSVSEGSPKVILEAMACGLPIISTNVGDVKNILGDVGIISDDKIKDFAANLCDTVNKDWNRMEISRFINNRSWESITDNLDNIYMEFLNG